MKSAQGALQAAYDSTNHRLNLTRVGFPGKPIPPSPSGPPLTNYNWTGGVAAQLTKWTVTTDGTHASQVGINLISPPQVVFTLSAGTTVGSSGLRDWYLLPGTTGTDFYGRILIDPLFFGNNGADDIFPQMGLVLRAQESGGRRRGVTINNGTIFGLAQVNMGVWSSALDGTDFLSRTLSFPLFSNPAFPYWIEARLKGTILGVRCWGQNDAEPTWSDVNRARVIDIDRDIDPAAVAANPSPTGTGQVGVIVAHLGTSPQSALRTQYTYVAALGPKPGYGNPFGASLTTSNTLRAVVV